MSDRQTLLKDASYEFLPLLNHLDESEKKRYACHNAMEKDAYNGKIKLRITVKSPLHVGSGQQDYDKAGNVIKKHMRRNRNVVIPGSSLKGAVRSVAEAVSYSCAIQVPDPSLKTLLPSGNNRRCSCEKGKLCITCSIFGMTSNDGNYRGKVKFGEFVLQEKKMQTGELQEQNMEKMILPSLNSPFKDYPDYEKKDLKKCKPVIFNDRNKPSYGNERIYYCKACQEGNCEECEKADYYDRIKEAGPRRKMEFRGRKFYSTDGERRGQKRIEDAKKEETYYEMIKEGNILEGEILFQNLREDEGRLLAYALNIGNHFNMKLGCGKAYGYGKVEITLLDVENMGNGYLPGKKLSKELVQRWAEEYRNTDGMKETIEKFEEIMKKSKELSNKEME